MTLSLKLLNWLASDDTGLSSRTILAWMETGMLADVCLDYPLDPADLGRCIRLLDLEPTYRARITDMAGAGPEWARLVSRWADLEALYREEAPSGRAPRCYALMRELIDEAREGKAK